MYPTLIVRLFENEGAGPLLRKDIMPFAEIIEYIHTRLQDEEYQREKVQADLYAQINRLSARLASAAIGGTSSSSGETIDGIISSKDAFLGPVAITTKTNTPNNKGVVTMVVKKTTD